MKYFLRVLPENRLNYSSGERVEVEIIGGGYGLIALDETKEENKTKIAELSALADKHRGLEHLTEESYGDYKKKYPLASPNLQRNPLKQVRIFKPDEHLKGSFAQPAMAPAAPVAVVEGVLPPAQPAAVPATSEPLKPFTPRVGKPPKPKPQAE